MELLLITLICAWALFVIVRHLMRRFKKGNSCGQDCQNCPEAKHSCDLQEQKHKIERSEEKWEK